MVATVYGHAVTRSHTCCGGPPSPKGVAAQRAGYTQDELEALPEDAVVNAFGCGNPVAFSGVKEGDTVLDLGSGAGIDLLIAAKKVGPRGKVIGVDMTDAMIEKARGVIAASNLSNVEVRRGLIEELPVEDCSVDWVISNCVINLSPEKDKVFAEIARVLKPGGRMLVSDIVVKDLPEEVRRDLKLYCSCVSGAISEAAYLDGMMKAGLGEVEIRERIPYDASSLEGLLASDEDAFEGTGCCSGGNRSPGELAVLLGGRVWSAQIYARKPV
jgi:SAM-dependent methyltransferase